MGVRSLIANSVKWAIPLAYFMLTASPALPHGSLTMDEDLCKLSLGRYQIHFAGYQPFDKRDPSRFTEFCEDIPAIGRTFVVLDLVDPKLRKMPITVRVMEDQGAANGETGPVVFELPVESHPSGSISYQHTFVKPGNFVGVITAGNGADRMVARFPFSVGRKAGFWAYGGYLIAALIAAAGLIVLALKSHDRVLQNLGGRQ